MGALERFLHDEAGRTPALVKAALSHVQFETIHPFLDGNGRIGRLLITMLLCAEGVLQQPLLYLSLYFKQNRRLYYDLLDEVRGKGDWERWLLLFAEAVRTTAEQALRTARDLVELFRRDRERIGSLGRASGSALRVHHELQRRPASTVAWLSTATKLSVPTAGKAVEGLMRLGIVKEVTGRRRDRVYVYRRYLGLLSQGTETS